MQKVRTTFWVCIALCSFAAAAQMSDGTGSSTIPSNQPPTTTNGRVKMAPRFGHNLAATTYLLEPWQCTLGLQAIGCGITKRWTLATVPWLYQNYNMYSVVNRIRLANSSSGGAWNLQFSYFKTFPKSQNPRYITYPYQMEAYWLQIIRSFPIAKHYRVYVNVHTNYYVDDKRPFSMRRPIIERNDGQLNISTLHEIALFRRWYLMAELGTLDLAQPSPYVHSGFSFGRSGETYEWHLGFSLTATPLALFNPRSRRDYQQELRDTESGFDQHLDRERAKRDYAIHPEFALQFYF